MPDLTGKCIRRTHIPPGATGARIRCPDCRSMLAKVGEIESGRSSVQLVCTGCRDGKRERKIFVIIFHATRKSYTDAIKSESLSVECDSHI